MGIDFRRPRHIRGFRLGEVLVWDFTSRPLVEKTVSGSIVAFSDGADAVKLKSCEVTIAPNLDGVSSVDVVHGGGNIFSSEWEQGSINTSGNNQTNSNVIRTAGFIRVFEGIHYSFTRDITTDIVNFRGYDAEQNYIGSGSTILNLITGYSVTNPMRAGDSTCTIEIKEGSGIAYIRMNDYSNDLSVKYTMCVGDTPLSQYSAYVSTTHTVNIGRTIYGGSADVVNGTGTESYDVIRLDSLPFIKNNNQNNPNGTYFSLDGVVVPFIGWGYGYGGRDTAMSNVLDKGSISAAGSTEPNNTFWWNNASTGWRVIWGEPNGGSSLADFMAFLTANNVVVGGTLSTPETFTFTPVPIISRLGDNTMWGDGDLEVTYYAKAN